jgi:hypothetical protein
VLHFIAGYLLFGFIITGFVFFLDMLVHMTRPPDWDAMKNAPPPKEGAFIRIFLKGMILWPFLLYAWIKATWYKRTLLEQAKIESAHRKENEIIQEKNDLIMRVMDWPPVNRKWVKIPIEDTKIPAELCFHILELPSGYKAYTHAIIQIEGGAFSCWRYMTDSRINLPIGMAKNRRLAKKLCQSDKSWMTLCHPLMVRKQVEVWRDSVKIILEQGYPLPFDLDEANKIADGLVIQYETLVNGFVKDVVDPNQQP